MDRERRSWADTSGWSTATAPATYLQEAWLRALDDGVSCSSVAFAWDLRGDLDHRVLREALQRLVERHASLRTSLEREGGARQIVWPAAEVDLALVDLSRSAEADVGGGLDGEVERLIAEEVEVSLQVDDATTPLWRGFLVCVAPTHHVLVMVGHHALLDMECQRILHEDLTALYREVSHGRASLVAPLSRSLGDFAQWQREPLPAAMEEFWRRELGAPRRRPDVPYARSWRGGRYRLERLELPVISAADVHALRATAAWVGASLGSALRALVAALLIPYAAEDVVVGVVHANRGQAGFCDLIGELVDQLPVRIDVSGEPTFPELVRRADAAWKAARRQNAPLGAIADVVNGAGGARDGLLYDVAVNWFPGGLALPVEELPAVDGGVLQMTARQFVATERAEFDHAFPGAPPLGFNMWSTEDGSVHTDLWSSAGAFAPETLAALACAFGQTVTAVAAGSTQSLRTLVPRVAAL